MAYLCSSVGYFLGIAGPLKVVFWGICVLEFCVSVTWGPLKMGILLHSCYEMLYFWGTVGQLKIGMFWYLCYKIGSIAVIWGQWEVFMVMCYS